MPSFYVGDAGIESMVTIVSESGILGMGLNLIAGTPTHGIIGWTFLKYYRVTFDYQKSRLILEPYEYYQEKWPHLFDSVGLMIAYKNGVPIVDHMLPGTPAESSGIQVNDKLLMVDGVDVTEMDALEISEMVMGEPGTTVDFLFERGGKKFRIKMERVRLFKE